MSKEYLECTNTNCREYQEYFKIDFRSQRIFPMEIILLEKDEITDRKEYSCRINEELSEGSYKSRCDIIESLNNQSKLLKKLNELLNKYKVELEDTGE